MNFCPDVNSDFYKSIENKVGKEQAHAIYLDYKGEVPDNILETIESTKYYRAFVASNAIEKVDFNNSEINTEAQVTNQSDVFDNNIANLLSGLLFSMTIKSTDNLDKKFGGVTKEQVKNFLINKKSKVENNPTLSGNYETVLNNFDYYYDLALDKASRVFKLSLEEELQDEEDRVLNKRFDGKEESHKKNLSNKIKQLFLSTKKLKRSENPKVLKPNQQGNYAYAFDLDNELGIETYIDFEVVYPKAIDMLSESVSGEDMMNRLDYLINFEPSVIQIKRMLETNEVLRKSFYSSFAMQSPTVIVTGKQQQGETTNYPVKVANNQAKHSTKIRENWITELTNKFEAGYYDVQIKRNYVEIKTELEKELSKDDININEVVELLVSFYDNFGLTIDNEVVKAMLTSTELQKDYGGTAKGVANYLKNSLGKHISKYRGNKEIASMWINATKAEEKDRKPYYNFYELDSLAEVFALFDSNIGEAMYLNASGEAEYNYKKRNYLSEFFLDLKAVNSPFATNDMKLSLLTKLSDYAQDPRFSKSSWLLGENGMLIDDGDGYRLNYANLKYYTYQELNGFKDFTLNDGTMYEKLDEESYKFVQIQSYLEKIDEDLAVISQAIPSDAGKLYQIIAKRQRASYLDNGALERTSPLYTTLYNTILQEIEAIKAASELLFNVDELGNLTPKEISQDVKDNLEKYTHYKTIKDGEPVWWEEIDGVIKPTGRVFQFHAKGVEKTNDKGESILHTLNDVVAISDEDGNTVMTLNELIYSGLFDETKHRPLITSFLNEFITQQVLEAEEAYSNVYDTLEVFPNFYQFLNIPLRETNETDKEYSETKEKAKKLAYRKLITEFVLNEHISLVEQANFLNGTLDEYKDSINTNKRAKQIISPSYKGWFDNKFYTVAVIADRELESKSFDDLVNGVASSLKMYKTYTSKDYDIAKIKIGKDLNDFEKDLHRITHKYLKINTGDAQGYITISRYEDVLKSIKGWDESLHSSLFEKLKAQEKELLNRGKILTLLTKDELETSLEILKPFYYNRFYNESINKVVSNQIKYSALPLIPQLVQGTDLERIMHRMNSKTSPIDEIVFESAEKVGSTVITKISDKDGYLLDTFESSIKGKKLENRHYGIQQENPEHLVDYTANLGTQLMKILIENLQGNYDVNGEILDATKIQEVYMDLMSSMIEDDLEAVNDDFGVSIKQHILQNGEKYKYWGTDNLNRIQEKLKAELKDRAVSQNLVSGLEYEEVDNPNSEGNDKTNRFKVPLFFSIFSKKFESIILSVYDSNVRKRKNAGGIGVLFSNAFINKLSASDITGIQWLDKKKQDKTLKIHKIDGGKVTKVEVLLPAWSKSFFDKGELIDINTIPEELRTIIGYRLPSETKHSIITMEVVGFLPSVLSGAISVPDELITQSGADFDIDKLFLLMYKYKREKTEDGFTFNKLAFNKGETPEDVNKRYIDYLKYSRKFAKERFNKERAFDRQIEDIFDAKNKSFAKEQQKVKANLKKAKAFDSENIDEIVEFLVKNDFEKVSALLQTNSDYLTDLLEKKKILQEEEEDSFFNADWTQEEIKELNESIDKINKKISQVTNKIEQLSPVIEEYNELLAQYNLQENEGIKKAKKVHADARKKLQEKVDKLQQAKAKVFQDLQKNFPISKFKELNIYKQNSEVARQNYLMDLFHSILQSPTHYADSISPNSFDEFSSVKREQDKLNNRDAKMIQPLTNKGQRLFRFTNIQGRGLKGQAVNIKGLTGIGQVAGMYFSDEMSFYVKYSDKDSNLEQLRVLYKDNIVDDTEKSITVKHSNIGKAANGSYLAANGALVTENVGSIVANILDIVKEGLPDNFNDLTFNIIGGMLMTGVSPEYASWFIGQPILNDISRRYYSNQSMVNDNDTEQFIYKTKVDYTDTLVRVRQALGENLDAEIQVSPDVKMKKYKLGRDGKYIIPKDLIKSVLGYDPSERFDTNLTLLKAAYSFDAKTVKPKGKVFNPSKWTREELVKYEKYLIYQLQLSESFNTYKKTGDVINDVIKVTAFDRINVNPNFNKTTNIEYTMNKLAGHDNPAVLIKGMSFIEQLYPKFFGRRDKSAYPILESFYEQAFKTPFDAFGGMFLTTLPAFSNFKKISLFTKRNYNETVSNKVDEFLNFVINSSYDTFQITGERLETLLGTKKDKANKPFNELSVARQLEAIKRKYKSDITTFNILKLMKLDSDKRVSFDRILVDTSDINSNVEDLFVKSFKELLQGRINGKFDEDIKTLAENLVNYTAVTNGFQYSRNSFARFIPTNHLVDIGLTNYLYSIKDRIGVEANYFERYIDRFYQNNWNNSDIVPKVVTEYQLKDGEYVIKGVNWNPSNGLVKIKTKDFDKGDFNTKNSPYLLVVSSQPYTTETGQKRFVNTRKLIKKVASESTDFVYFVEANKLGDSRNFYELTDKSIIVENNAAVNEQDVLAKIRQEEAKMIKIESSSNPLIKAGVKPSDMYGNAAKDIQMAELATQFIGFQSGNASVSSTNKYREAWGSKANTGIYTENDTIMVSGSGLFRGVTKEQIQSTLTQKYKPLLEKATAAKSSFVIGNRFDKGNLSDQLISEYLIRKGYKVTKKDGYSEFTLNGKPLIKRESPNLFNQLSDSDIKILNSKEYKKWYEKQRLVDNVSTDEEIFAMYKKCH